jgi:hypothetical protein
MKHLLATMGVKTNTCWIREGHFQMVYSTNVWCGILGNKIIGPYFFREKLNGLV